MLTAILIAATLLAVAVTLGPGAYADRLSRAKEAEADEAHYWTES